MIRQNRGKPAGQYIGQVEGGWTLYCTGEGRYKICSIEPISGKANYTFIVSDLLIDMHGGLDAGKLRSERPEIFEATELFLRSGSAAAATDESDKYGDLALSRRRKLTPFQLWHRGLLQMRRIELEHTAAHKNSMWESGIRMLWAGIFKTRITEDEVKRQVKYITSHDKKVNLDLLLAAEQQFYSQKYAPNSCATLAAQLDTIGGTPEDNIDDLL